MHSLSEDPIEVSKAYLGRPNDIQLFPFLCQFMIPVYEEVTGESNTMRMLLDEFKRRWKKRKKRVMSKSEVR